MEDTLKTIQKFSKAGKILSKIVMICFIVVACLYAVGAVLLFIGAEGGLKFGEVNIRGLIEKEAGVSGEQIYISVISGIIMSVAEVVVSFFAARYFENELKAGTPFTIEGAKEIRRLGIIVIVVPLAGLVVSELISALVEMLLSVKGVIDMRYEGSIMLGVMFIVGSYIFKYGAELLENKSAEE